MRRVLYYSALILLGLCATALAQAPTRDPGRLAEIRWTGRSQLLELTNRGFIIDHPHNGTAEIWLTPAQFDTLTSEGWNVRWIPDQAAEMWKYLRTKYAGTGRTLGAYHDYDGLTSALLSLATQYPDLCRLSSIGESVQGRDLWVMKITDNPDTEEAEPEVRYTSTMHGDEPVGMELLLDLIQLLLNNYATDARIKHLVDEEEIWIMPLMNPDGYSASPPQRWNANGYDLNRNFPDIVTDPNNIPAGRQPETQAVMAFSAGHQFVLSANFHAGSLVVNYPMDSPVNDTDTESPDNDYFYATALTYAQANPPMYASTEFTHGITVGADWYIIRGGMQDWMYNWMGGREVTIELDDDKFPSDTRLPALWNENRESMLSYLELAIAKGVRGRVLDAATSGPLSATILVAGRDQYNSHPLYLFTDQQVSDYYCLLQPGKWDLTFATGGYSAQTIQGVMVTAQTMTHLDVYLGKAPTPGACAWGLY